MKKLTFLLTMMLFTFGIGNAWAEGTWTLVKDASTLAAGDQVVIAATGYNYALSTTQNTNNRGRAEVTKNGDDITFGSDVQVLTLEAGTTSGTLAFNTGSGYLYAASSSKNYLKTQTTNNANASWKIEITSEGVATIKAQGTNTRNWLRYNNSSSIFACYSSGQGDVCLYKYIEEQGGEDTPTPSITLDPTSKDFGSVLVGETATQEITITATNITEILSASIDDDTNYAVSAVAGNKVTVTYQPQAAGTHPAVLTVKAGEEASATVSLSGKGVQALDGTWILVTDASSLKAGDEIIIAASESDVALSTTQNGNNRGQVEITKSGNTISATSEAQVLTLQAGNVANTLALYTGAGYLCAASSGSNYLRTETELSGNSSWTIAIADGVATLTAQGTYTRNIMQHNATSKIFACYGSASQKALSLYRKAGTQYNVTVNPTANGTVTASPTSAEKGTTITLTVTPAGGYLLDALTVTDASSNPITVTDNTFTMPESDVTVAATFKANEKPAATLTLSINGNEELFPGSWKQDDVVALPSITSDCVKEFVGWDANPTCNVAPEYKAGDSYTLASTAQTLYAVYADVAGGETVNIAYSGSTTGNMTGNNDAATLGLDADEWSIISAKGGASNHVGLNKDGEFRLYYSANGGNTLTITAPKTIAVAELDLKVNYNNAWVKVGGNTITPVDGVYTINATEFVIGNANTSNVQVHIYSIDVTLQGDYSNYSTTCAAAPKAEVNPAEVAATATGGNGTVSVTYENVNTEGVTVAIFNDNACTEAFADDWLTVAFDGEKDITYTVAANTTYAGRTAYIQLTAPEVNGATDPAVVVIPVTQAGKDKVFASLAELVAADLTAGDEVTVTLNNDMIKSFYTITAGRAGVVFDVQKDGKDIKIFYNNQTTIGDWEVGGKLSGTLTNVKWSTYSNEWQLAPTANTWDWANLTYTAPATIESIAVSGTPTKTTYTDGEVFNPAGLVATATYTDATNEDVTNLVSWTFDPATLAKGQTSVNVVALLNSVSSPAYTVNGLTVNDIPTKTVAEFIAAGGVRCYLEGIVSNITNTEYGNFDLTDESGTIFVYGCLNGAGESKQFESLGVKEGDKIKVIAEEYTYYQSTTHEVIDAQYVSHISAATISIDDITMEEGETKTIAATVTPAGAAVTYTIKENTDNAISLSDNTITALAVGTATITASVAAGADYLANSVDFTVTVNAAGSTQDVVILAEYDGKWYAMMAQDLDGENKTIAALEVEYFNGKLYNVDEADKASITWSRTIAGATATFKNGENYLYGISSKTELKLSTEECAWTYDGNTYKIGARTFLYREEANGFKNYNAETNAGKDDYSDLPVVTAPVFATAIEIGGGDNSTVLGANNGQTVNVIVDRSFVAEDGYYTLCVPFNMPASIVGTAYQISGITQHSETEVTVNCTSAQTILAGQPYLIVPSATINGFVVDNVTIANEAKSTATVTSAGVSITMHGVLSQSSTTNGLYWVGNEGYLYNDHVAKLGLRAYFEITTTDPSGIPPRMRIVTGENAETSVDNIITTDAPQKVIENGQLIIIRDGVKYNVQGVRL